MTLNLPKPVSAYFEADRGSGESVEKCFVSDAVVRDEGNTYHGTNEIRKWRADVAAKFTYTCRPLAVEQQDDRTVVTCRLEGSFPGSPVNLRFFFRLAGDKIQDLEIIP
jgi:hypothetical protein